VSEAEKEGRMSTQGPLRLDDDDCNPHLVGELSDSFVVLILLGATMRARLHVRLLVCVKFCVHIRSVYAYA
jgi:hypothetical protein